MFSVGLQLAAAEKDREAAQSAAAAAARGLETTQAALLQAQAQQRAAAEEAAAAAARAGALSAELAQLKAQQVGEAMDLVDRLVDTLPDDEQHPLEGARAAAGGLGRSLRQQQRGAGFQQLKAAGAVEEEVREVQQQDMKGKDSKQQKRLEEAHMGSGGDGRGNGDSENTSESGKGAQG
jgi:hypothetical protein